MEKKLKFLKINPNAKLPMRGSETSAGMDLSSIESKSILPGKYAPIKTGLKVALPNNCYGRIAPRSGLAVRNGVSVLAGVIDSDYRGEIICMLINHGEKEFFISVGDRIAQLIVESILLLEADWTDNLDETERGAGGFGSTGIGISQIVE
ncbi:MAG: dUTP diphosphatase [Tatlockia sp.]|jgi:dUTP pyrophosphatase|nr:dUTP diphosphatase [Tatlockia sp.]